METMTEHQIRVQCGYDLVRTRRGWAWRGFEERVSIPPSPTFLTKRDALEWFTARHDAIIYKPRGE